MDERATFPDWPVKRNAIRAALAAREPRHDHTGPLRLRNGAVVEPGSVMTGVVARAAFLEIAVDVEPRLLVELAGAPLDQYAAAWDAAGGPSGVDPWPPGVGFQTEVAAYSQTAMINEDGALWRWCERWGLPVWDDVPAEAVDAGDRALLRYAAERGWGLVEGAYAVYAWRVYPFPLHRTPRFGDVFLCRPVIEDVDLGLDTPLCLPPQRWDPQREDRASATKRITAELGRAVRAELGRIEVAALRTAVATPVKRTGLEHLAWLARYQFRHESFSAIADDVCKERQTVTEFVKAAAALVGLPLREATRGGQRRGDR